MCAWAIGCGSASWAVGWIEVGRRRTTASVAAPTAESIVDPVSAFRVLLVCVGNVCRSPFAERLLRLRLSEAGVADGTFEVSSAGTGSPGGAPMSAPMRERLEALGGDAEGFAARQVQPPMLEQAGLVLAATREIRGRVLEDVPGALRRTFTVRELAALAPGAPHDLSLPDLVRACAERRSRVDAALADVADPIGRPDDVQDAVAAQLDEAVTAIAGLLAHRELDARAGTALQHP